MSATRAEVGVAELVGALSLGVDLGFGQPMEHVLRQCAIALDIADCMGLTEHERSVVYYTALLINVGCHTDAHEQAKWFGDDIELRATKYAHDLHGVRSALAGVRRIGHGQPALQRFRVGVNFAWSGRRDLDGMFERHAAMACALAGELQLPVEVREAVAASYEQWDGKGWPGRLGGEDIPVAARVSQLAEFVEVAHRSGGVPAAIDLAQRLSGSQFAPDVVDAFVASAAEILDGLDTRDSWGQVVAGEPQLSRPLTDAEFDDALTSIADFVDLKSPYTLGHARAVACLAADAAERLGLGADTVTLVRRAGLAHGLGRIGVSNTIWDKPGPLGAAERERVRLQPYFTERMLHQSPALAEIGSLAAQVRERLDGSGYPRCRTGAELTPAARLLAAADVFQSMAEPRPYRPALTSDDAVRELRVEVRAGRLDGAAVEAVLAAAGQRAVVRRQWPAGLTTREVEVLTLVARGSSSHDIASRLAITPKTARNHTEHIYLKIGATSRVEASLFAMKHGLLADSIS